MSQPPTNEQFVSAIMSDGNIPKFYANGFIHGGTESDIFVIFQSGPGIPSAVVQMSFILAKSMVQELGKTVEEYERMTGQRVLTMSEIKSAIGNREKKNS
jgi:hypothetical protein